MKLSASINPIAGIYSLVGKCQDMLDNRLESVRILQSCLLIDPSCVDAAEYLIEKGLLSSKEKKYLYDKLSLNGTDNQYLNDYYR